MQVQDLINAARSVQDYVLDVRRHLHSRPETRWEEEYTLSYIVNEVLKMFDDAPVGMLSLHRGEGGSWFDLTFDPTLPRIIFRADVDALPVQEATCLEFTSSVVGRMHACGHDVHTAMLLGFAKLVAEGIVKPTCNLRLVFQRAEENPGTKPRAESGGEVLVKEGVLEGVSAAYGLHIWNSSASGTPGVFYSRPGGFLGNSGRLQIKISCSGGHAAMPHSGTNALRVTAVIQSWLDTFVARYLPPHEPAALEPVILKAGTASNIMPASAELWYGVRTTLPREDHNSLMAAIEQEVRYIGAQFSAHIEFNRILGHPALINDPESFERVSSILRGAGEQVEVHPPILGGEDFAHYLYGVSGSFWLLGARAPGTGDHHSPTFNPDESVFWKGVLFWLLLATT